MTSNKQARLRELEQLKKENKKLEQLQVVRERGVRTKAADRQQLEQAKESNQQEKEKRRLENILKLEAETAKVAKQMLAQQAKEKQAREKRQQEKEKQEKEKRSKEKRQKEMSSFN